MKTIAFFGHRRLWKEDIRDKLKDAIVSNLDGETRCMIGVHGEYDRLALSVCRELRSSYPKLKIIVVFTDLKILQKRDGEFFSKADYYDDVETMIYDIEEVHFKRRITLSNKKMVEDSQLIICYADMNSYQSGAKNAVAYAIKQEKKVINLFK